MSPLTSFHIGGPALLFAEPAGPQDLEWCLRYAMEHRLPVYALGGGSNVLIADQGIRGFVLRYADGTRAIHGEGDEAHLRAGARAPLSGTARWLARQGWEGLEWAEGIPGTIGGAVVGNAGAYGGEIAGAIEEVDTFSLEDRRVCLDAAACTFAYRMSAFKGQDPTRTFILSARFRLRRQDRKVLSERVRLICARRKERTPAGLTCGSVFKNPPGESAGRLIEECGLKGASEGGAQISERHANYIVNRGGATARDVAALIALARSRVRELTGIELFLEIQTMGLSI